MAESSKLRSQLPGLLVVVGLFFLIAGFFSGGPELVGGIVFGGVCLAAAGAILSRRAHDAKPKSNGRDAAQLSDRTDLE
jgi:hypothetical protein